MIRSGDAAPVLDTSAVMAVLNDEPGAARVIAALPGAAVSAVNLAEVVSKLADYRMAGQHISRDLAALELHVESFGSADAARVGELRRFTRAAGLSLGDRACLALAERLGAAVLTADRVWATLNLGIAVELIR